MTRPSLNPARSSWRSPSGESSWGAPVSRRPLVVRDRDSSSIATEKVPAAQLTSSAERGARRAKSSSAGHSG
jgi:hypothetical protein